MAVNLEINVDPSKAEAGLQKIGQAANQAADSAADASQRSGSAGVEALQGQLDRVKQLQKEMRESEGAVESEVDALRDAEKAAAGIADNMDNAADMSVDAANAASDVADGMERAGKAADDSASKVEKTGGSFADFNGLLEIGTKAIEGIAAGIDALAEGGNPAAIELKESFSRFKDEMFAIADDPRFQGMLLDLAHVIVQDVIPALRAMADASLSALTVAQNATADAIVSTGEALGVLSEGTTEILRADQERKAASVEAGRAAARAAREEQAAKSDVLDVTKELARIDAERAAAGRNESLGEVRSLEEIQDVIDDTREKLQDQNLTEKEKLDLLELVRQAEQRKLDIAQEARSEWEQSQAEARRAEQEKQRADEAEAKRAADKAEREKDAADEKAKGAQRERADIEETGRTAIRTRSAVVRQAEEDAKAASDKTKEALTDPAAIEAWLRQWASATGRGINTARQMMARGDITPGVTGTSRPDQGNPLEKLNGGNANPPGQPALEVPAAAGAAGGDAAKKLQEALNRNTNLTSESFNTVGQILTEMGNRLDAYNEGLSSVRGQLAAILKGQQSRRAAANGA